MLDTGGLERFVVRHIPWRGIDRNLRERHLHAISVSATHVGSGHTMVFLSSAEPVPREWSRDPFVRHRAAKIGPRHVLASAAIPMLFPSVKIGEEFFTDGGLRQNTPDVTRDPARGRSPAADLAQARHAGVGLDGARQRRGVPQAAVPRRQGAQRAAARSHPSTISSACSGST
jgi:predicted acylesterase/phospholipase RssA